MGSDDVSWRVCRHARVTDICHWQTVWSCSCYMWCYTLRYTLATGYLPASILRKEGNRKCFCDPHSTRRSDKCLPCVCERECGKRGRTRDYFCQLTLGPKLSLKRHRGCMKCTSTSKSKRKSLHTHPLDTISRDALHDNLCLDVPDTSLIGRAAHQSPLSSMLSSQYWSSLI